MRHHDGAARDRAAPGLSPLRVSELTASRQVYGRVGAPLWTKQPGHLHDTGSPAGDTPMSLLAVLAVLVAGLLAGAVNAVVGSGGLITFPILLSLGFSPVVANVSNTVGMSVGNLGAVIGYRRELRGQLPRLQSLGGPAIAGSAIGAVLLLLLPQRVFNAVVPVLIVVAVGLVIAQPWLAKRVQRHGSNRWQAVALRVGVFLNAIYGGYFGAAQGVILVSLLAVVLADSLQHINALKNAIIMLVNGTAAILFLFIAHISWEPAFLLAVSSIIGGRVGASLGRRLSPVTLRAFIVLAGLATVVKLLAR
jgi:uncharacterized membrane protein YfcA